MCLIHFKERFLKEYMLQVHKKDSRREANKFFLSESLIENNSVNKAVNICLVDKTMKLFEREK